MKNIRIFTGLAACVAVGISSQASALDIVIDYSLDTSGVFASNTQAKAALDAAAADLEAAITTTLGAVTDTVSSSVGGSEATYDFRWNYTNPSTGASVNVSDAALAADTVIVHAGWRNLTGTTLGQGGPGGAGISVGGGISNPTDFATAVSNANAAGTANWGRGGGPTFGNFSGTLGGQPYDVDYGLGHGNIWFDLDTNNDNAADSASQLDAEWSFDHTAAVQSGQSDFYSVALHELLHVLGIGTSDNWDDNVSGNDWLGSDVTALLGSGTGVIDGDEAHIENNVMGTVVGIGVGAVDGASQEVVMDPNITVGTRKYLTDVDLAFLNDIGWETVPEPSSLALLSLGAFAVLGRRRSA